MLSYFRVGQHFDQRGKALSHSWARDLLHVRRYAHSLPQLGDTADRSGRPAEELSRVDAQHLAQHLQSAGRYPVRARLVFLHLLKADTDRLAERVWFMPAPKRAARSLAPSS